MSAALALGKLSAELLARLIASAPLDDSRVVLGPGIGLDCAVVRLGEHLLALKTDPITFTSDEIGWYAVQVNANDVATVGATPRWFMATVLLPEGKTDDALAMKISTEIGQACRELGVSLVGGHTEITQGLDRPIVSGVMIGVVERPGGLITPRGATPGDRVLLTKGVPIEGTAILAREFPDRLLGILTNEELRQAQDYLYNPGISVVREAVIASQAGRVTAMHDPTEGGLAMALWELARACDRALLIELDQVPISPLSARVCQVFGLDPLASIASGALLLTVRPEDADAIRSALSSAGLICTDIGVVGEGPSGVYQWVDGARMEIPRPQRDELARLLEENR